MTGIRKRKETLIFVLAAHRVSGMLEEEHVKQFTLMYQRARDMAELDQVTAVVRGYIDRWRTDNDRFSRVVRSCRDEDDLDAVET